MKNLIFVSSWPNRKTAWSGTPNGLYTALEKKCVLQEIEVAPAVGTNPLVNRAKSLWDFFTCHIRQNRAIEQRIDSHNLEGGNPLLVFGEYTSGAVGNSYCYQDLSMDYLLRLRQQNHPAANYGINDLVPTCFVKRKIKLAEDFYRDCAGVFTMSGWLREDLIKNTGLPENKVHHVGGGCNIDVSKIDCSKKEGYRFLFVGRSWVRKNGPLVVEAFEKLRSMYPEKKLELYISGPKEMPAELAGKEGIVFLGLLTHAELIEYYNLCDYFVMPSKFEAYGLVFAEALSFGLPCIGKDFCAMPEFIQEGVNGYLIRQEDPEELARVMAKMVENGSALASYVQARRSDYVNQYSWDSVADRILAVLKADGYELSE